MDAELDEIDVGPYRGWVTPGCRDPSSLEQFRRLAGSVTGEQCQILSENETDRIVRVSLACESGPIDVAIKSYGKRNAARDRADRLSGSRAVRSTRTALILQASGVGTPRPMACLDRWEQGRLLESYFVTEYVGWPSFKDELVRLYRHDPQCAKLMALLETVANSVRGMHAAGVVHRDLGNQNILVRPADEAGGQRVQFIDLNRARLIDAPSARERARDISRLTLPSDFLRVFIEMYAQAPPELDLLRYEDRYRRSFARHTRTRSLRHPVRERRRKRESVEEDYPPDRELWVWDERSGQPVGALKSIDRRRYYPKPDVLRQATSTLRAAGPVRPVYVKLLDEAFTQPVEMAGRVGIALHPQADHVEREQDLLDRLAGVPVLLRYYRHEGEDDWDRATEWTRRLHSAGTAVSVAAVQDRIAVREPSAWAEFCEAVFSRVADVASWIEIAHAINRSKWGIWSLAEYRRMMEAFLPVRAHFPEVPITGPAAIDFEYPFLLAALKELPDGLRFSALSHHLYVDRRGAPEHKQAGYDSLRKFALARAIARWSGHCDDRLIISETNWPLAGTGVYSPVGAPYQSPGERRNDPSVSEDEYGHFMIRYLLIALCSGLVEAVYWWRLVARGYGLVDDTDPANWRERPAYRMLQFFLQSVGTSRFVRRETPGPASAVYWFDNPDGTHTGIAYAHGDPEWWPIPPGDTRVFDSEGNRVEMSADTIKLQGEPVYIFAG
jgi:tRNA A-37 threonylcarbamoyl transferase component Bud32